MSGLPLVCIIGAGSSGIAAAKVLHERNIPFDCFERTERIGGLWDIRNEASSAYRSLHVNTSKRRMEFSDYPMPDDIPDFPHHTHILAYFNDYVDHFGFRDKITFNTAVEHAGRRDDGVWEIRLSNGETHEYDALVVANGHHWDPRWPAPPFPGKFNGKEIHSHHYADQRGFEDKNVVVPGMGNSAMDIAVELSYIASNVYLAARRGAHIAPKYAFGRPIDTLPVNVHIPWTVRRWMFEVILRLSTGHPEDYGLPKPDHRLGEAHPTVSSEILSRVGHGTVKPKPNIAELIGDKVKFADGSVETVDAIIYCTGYKVTFPFFDPDFVSAPSNDLPLFRRVFKPGIDNLFFIGLLQPLGATMPIAEVQSKWVADYLQGRYALPPPGELAADMENERERMFKRYVATPRHTMQVDFDDYMHALRKERKRGARRAQARQNAMPVPARAGAAPLHSSPRERGEVKVGGRSEAPTA